MDNTMYLRKHLRLFLIVSAAWFLFWVAGLPEYYRQYSAVSMMAFDILLLPPLWLIVYSSVKKAGGGHFAEYRRKTDLADEPFVGMWRNREDLKDSRWVRNIREREWSASWIRQ
jgi:hypothetical protein